MLFNKSQRINGSQLGQISQALGYQDRQQFPSKDIISECDNSLNIQQQRRSLTPKHQPSQSQQLFKKVNLTEKKVDVRKKTPQKLLTHDQKIAVNKILSPFKKQEIKKLIKMQKYLSQDLENILFFYNILFLHNQRYSDVSFVPTASSRTHRAVTPNGQNKINISPLKKSDLSRSQYVIQQVEKDFQYSIKSPVRTLPNETVGMDLKGSVSSRHAKQAIDFLTHNSNELDYYLRMIEEKNKEKIMLQKDIHEYKREILVVEEDVFKLKKSKQNFKDERHKFQKNIDKLNQEKYNKQHEDKVIASEIFAIESAIDDIKLKAGDIQQDILLQADIIRDLTERIANYKKSYSFLQVHYSFLFSDN